MLYVGVCCYLYFNQENILFHPKTSKGLIFYVHGNAGSIDGWKEIAKTYTDLGYDLFIFDFRGFGKSEGMIENEAQFLEDVRCFYRLMQKRYTENQMVIIGYSVGTGAAAMLASENDPKALILLAPYYNLKDMMRRDYSYAPTFILKYKFETNRYLPGIKVPVTIFHGRMIALSILAPLSSSGSISRKQTACFPSKIRDT